MSHVKLPLSSDGMTDWIYDGDEEPAFTIEFHNDVEPDFAIATSNLIISKVNHIETISQVREWHEAFDVPNRDEPCLPEDRIQLRLRILEEEVAELRAAAEAGDLIETIDALTDIQYVLDGTYLEFGMAGIKTEAFARVQASNMSKLGEDGKPIHREDGKVLKGPNFFKPDFSDLV